MKVLFTLLISLFTLAATAQVPAPNMLSLKGYGGNGDDEVGSFVTKTSDGGFIIGIGSNSAFGTGNIDSFCTSGGDRDVYMKYSADGSTLEWSKCFTDGGIIFPQNDGSFVLGGTTSAVPAGWAFKISKVNLADSILWRKTYGGQAASARLFSMITTPDGGYLMAGETNYADSDFTVHHGSWMDDDIGVIKVDSNGNKVWSTVIGGSAEDGVAYQALVNTLDGGCYVIGSTSSNDYDCTGNHGGASGSSDAYLVRFDANGNIIWHKDLGGTGYDGGDCGWPDGNGGIIIGGNTASHDGDVTHYVGGFWVLDVDSSGNILWKWRC